MTTTREQGASGGGLILGFDEANDITGSRGIEWIFGLDGDDRLRGILGDDVVHGGGGNDFVQGGDAARLYGATGDDLLFHAGLLSDPAAIVDGGPGEDSVLLPGSHDFTQGAEAVKNIEVFSLATPTPEQDPIGLVFIPENSVRLDAASIVLMTDERDVLRIDGDAADRVELVGTWNRAEPTAGAGFATFTSDAATLLIDTDIAVSFV